jgi:hypothetical protein
LLLLLRTSASVTILGNALACRAALGAWQTRIVTRAAFATAATEAHEAIITDSSPVARSYAGPTHAALPCRAGLAARAAVRLVGLCVDDVAARAAVLGGVQSDALPAAGCWLSCRTGTSPSRPFRARRTYGAALASACDAARTGRLGSPGHPRHGGQRAP